VRRADPGAFLERRGIEAAPALRFAENIAKFVFEHDLVIDWPWGRPFGGTGTGSPRV
jgi:hypothetical protein